MHPKSGATARDFICVQTIPESCMLLQAISIMQITFKDRGYLKIIKDELEERKYTLNGFGVKAVFRVEDTDGEPWNTKTLNCRDFHSSLPVNLERLRQIVLLILLPHQECLS